MEKILRQIIFYVLGLMLGQENNTKDEVDRLRTDSPTTQNERVHKGSPLEEISRGIRRLNWLGLGLILGLDNNTTLCISRGIRCLNWLGLGLVSKEIIRLRFV